jgi:hypothetical protein
LSLTEGGEIIITDGGEIIITDEGASLDSSVCGVIETIKKGKCNKKSCKRHNKNATT